MDSSIAAAWIWAWVLVIWTPLWHYHKNIWRFWKKYYFKFYYSIFPTTFNIALSIKSKDWSNSWAYFSEIKKGLNKIILEQNLEKIIRIKDFSDVPIFTNKSEAELFREEKNVDLIIWGSFSEDGLKTKDEWNQWIHQIDINFTYRHPNDRENNLKQLLLLDFSSKLAKKNYWKVLENSSFEDVKIVSKNLFFISMYIIGITTLLYWKIFQSIKILEWLNLTLLAEDEIFKKWISETLENLYRKVIQNCIDSKKDTQTWIIYCHKLLKTSPRDQNGLSALAFFYYIDGQFEESEKTVEIQTKLYPRYPSTEVNVAFLRMIQKKYKEWFHCYERMVQKKLDFYPLQVIEFLGGQFELRKEVGLLYWSGLISYFYWDKRIAKEDLNNFIKLFTPEDCQIMFNRAKKILEKLDK